MPCSTWPHSSFSLQCPFSTHLEVSSGVYNRVIKWHAYPTVSWWEFRFLTTSLPHSHFPPSQIDLERKDSRLAFALSWPKFSSFTLEPRTLLCFRFCSWHFFIFSGFNSSFCNLMSSLCSIICFPPAPWTWAPSSFSSQLYWSIIYKQYRVALRYTRGWFDTRMSCEMFTSVRLVNTCFTSHLAAFWGMILDRDRIF